MVKPPLLAALALLACVLAWSPAQGAELLANGGFEAGVDGWSATFGQLDTVSTPVRSGGLSARLASDALQSHEVYQWSGVAPAEPYQFGGWVLLNDPNVERVFLRISWFDSAGGLVGTVDSSWLTFPADGYVWLDIASAVSPAAARTARVGVRVQAAGAFMLYLDDFSLAGATPPAITPSPSPSPLPPSRTATPTPRPTPSPTSPAAPTRTPKPPAVSPSPGAEPEPAVFDRLTNGSFEQLRDDGTPYGWKDVGAALSAVPAPRLNGTRALALTSWSSSTKWAYQTVHVTPGGWYQASVSALAGSAQEAFLRLSWYGTSDGSGSAIDSVDSAESAGAGQGNVAAVSTGPVQAPSGARTAKVRLMVRPGSDAEVTAYFDAASLDRVAAPAAGSASPRSSSAGAGMRAGGDAPISAAESANGGGVALAAGATPLRFANVKPAATPAPLKVARESANYGWVAFIGIAVGLAAITFAGVRERARRRPLNLS